MKEYFIRQNVMQYYLIKYKSPLDFDQTTHVAHDIYLKPSSLSQLSFNEFNIPATLKPWIRQVTRLPVYTVSKKATVSISACRVEAEGSRSPRRDHIAK